MILKILASVPWVGVPVILQLDAKVNPAGNVGEAVQLVIAPPVGVALSAVMAEPTAPDGEVVVQAIAVVPVLLVTDMVTVVLKAVPVAGIAMMV